MSDTVPAIRGYRPSRFVPFDDGMAHRESLRLANLERYIFRARAGMPIFDENEQLSRPMAPPSQSHGSQSA
jgi:hypothetical protein